MPGFALDVPLGQKSFWTQRMVPHGDVAQVEARFGPFGDSANLDARWLHGFASIMPKAQKSFRRSQWNS